MICRMQVQWLQWETARCRSWAAFIHYRDSVVTSSRKVLIMQRDDPHPEGPLSMKGAGIGCPPAALTSPSP